MIMDGWMIFRQQLSKGKEMGDNGMDEFEDGPFLLGFEKADIVEQPGPLISLVKWEVKSDRSRRTEYSGCVYILTPGSYM